MIRGVDNKDRFKNEALLSQKKPGKKIFLNLHIMPHPESKDVRFFSYLVAGLLIVLSAIIFLVIYV